MAGMIDSRPGQTPGGIINKARADRVRATISKKFSVVNYRLGINDANFIIGCIFLRQFQSVSH